MPHSNAGLYVPPIARSRRVVGVIYVDSRLPKHEKRYPMTPSEVLPFLSGMADSRGLLPPWGQWWEDGIAALFPSDESRLAAEEEMRSLPLDYFLDYLDGSGWWQPPCAFLAFGENYCAERSRAQDGGWPVATMVGKHLHMLVDPQQVSRQIEQLAATLLGSACRVQDPCSRN